jgi:hypothetical protein
MCTYTAAKLILRPCEFVRASKIMHDHPAWAEHLTLWQKLCKRLSQKHAPAHLQELPVSITEHPSVQARMNESVAAACGHAHAIAVELFFIAYTVAQYDAIS